MSKKPKTGADKNLPIHKTLSRFVLIRPVSTGFGAFSEETGRLIAGGRTEYDALKRAGRLGWHIRHGHTPELASYLTGGW